MTSLSKWTEGRLFRRGDYLEVGKPVRVRRKPSPLAGESGKILEITPGDTYGPYLVQFENGLRYRYRRDELALTSITDSGRHTY
jgi:hypothetical protein